MLYLELMGGLGNQLFQIFTLISYSIDHDMDYRIFEFKHDKVSPLDNESIRNTYWTNLLHKLYEKTIKPQMISKHGEIKESDGRVLTNPVNKNNNYYFKGYYQSYHYFNNNLSEILDIINIEDTLSTIKNKTNYDYDNTISLHFRIGDYTKKPLYHTILSIDYYRNCINNLIINIGRDDWTILYYYEEVNKDIIDKHINTLQSEFTNISFVSIDHKLEDWEQMLTMSLCKHNIIANSTFSWWGAYLNQNYNYVYYPDTWFGPEANMTKVPNMILDNWIEIENK